MSHDKSLNKIIYMANQIATFFLSQPKSEAAAGVATHINKFWETRMRRQLFDRVAEGGEGLNPLVLEAMPLIRKPFANPNTAIGTGDDAAAGAPGGKGTAAGESLSEPSIPEHQ